jgi:hypothetical protein
VSVVAADAERGRRCDGEKLDRVLDLATWARRTLSMVGDAT